MPIKVSYTHARDNLADLWDEVEDTREAAVLQRRGHEDMALIPAGELAGLRETAHLLRSPRNAARLLAALRRGRRIQSRGQSRGKSRGKTGAQDLTKLRRELGL